MIRKIRAYFRRKKLIKFMSTKCSEPTVITLSISDALVLGRVPCEVIASLNYKSKQYLNPRTILTITSDDDEKVLLEDYVSRLGVPFGRGVRSLDKLKHGLPEEQVSFKELDIN